MASVFPGKGRAKILARRRCAIQITRLRAGFEPPDVWWLLPESVAILPDGKPSIRWSVQMVRALYINAVGRSATAQIRRELRQGAKPPSARRDFRPTVGLPVPLLLAPFLILLELLELLVLPFDNHSHPEQLVIP